MRLEKYLNPKVSKVKNLKVGLVDKCDGEYRDLLKSIEEEYEIKDNIISIIDEVNKQLKKNYRGKFRFDVCIDEDVEINNIKIKNDKIKEKVKIEWYKLNHRLSRLKTELERIEADKKS